MILNVVSVTAQWPGPPPADDLRLKEKPSFITKNSRLNNPNRPPCVVYDQTNTMLSISYLTLGAGLFPAEICLHVVNLLDGQRTLIYL